MVEYDVMLHLSEEELVKLSDEITASVIMKNREGKIKVKPGYDGLYGEPQLTETIEEEEEYKPKQKGLGDYF